MGTETWGNRVIDPTSHGSSGRACNRARTRPIRSSTTDPLAVIVDDLHAADTASLALFRHVARQARALRIVLLGTLRGIQGIFIWPE
jgi:hypothetical protein